MAKDTFSWLVLAGFSIVLVTLFTFPQPADGACCGLTADICFDLTPATPCCGNGKCNVFCCHCAGGCRQAPVKQDKVAFKGHHISHPAKRRHRRTESSLHFMDSDADGRLSLKEVQHYWRNFNNSSSHPSHRSARTVRLEFERHDRNHDGFINAQELDLDF